MKYSKPEIERLGNPGQVVQGSTSGVKTSNHPDGIPMKPALATSAAYEADE